MSTAVESFPPLPAQPSGSPPAEYPRDGELLGELIEDVKALTLYAVKTSYLPTTVDMKQLYAICQAKQARQPLSREQVGMLTEYYQVLERHLPAVTAKTLRATESQPPGNYRSSVAGAYLCRLWWRAAGVVAIILIFNLIQYAYDAVIPTPGAASPWWVAAYDLLHRAVKYLEPFTYGALGACAYLLRVTEDRLHTRQFDPDRIPEHWNRLALGTLSGGVIILFVEQVPNGDGGTIAVATAALGFLAGYSIDFLFQTLDRIIGAILPKVGLESVQRRAELRQNQELTQRYQVLLDETRDERMRKLLKEVVDDLQVR